MVWAMVLLDERFAPTVWAAMATMLAGVALVRPRTGRGNETLVPQVQTGENSAR
jgi:drug/metabolite transporter (DMT)-like permease